MGSEDAVGPRGCGGTFTLRATLSAYIHFSKKVFMYIGVCLLACKSAPYTCSTHKGLKRALNPLELDGKTVVSPSVSAEN